MPGAVSAGAPLAPLWQVRPWPPGFPAVARLLDPLLRRAAGGLRRLSACRRTLRPHVLAPHHLPGEPRALDPLIPGAATAADVPLTQIPLLYLLRIACLTLLSIICSVVSCLLCMANLVGSQQYFYFLYIPLLFDSASHAIRRKYMCNMERIVV